MQGFLDKINPNDRVLVIGDIRQHQAIEAGKPFEQMQQAGMPTARLDRIIRQRDPELLKAVEQLAAGETRAGIGMLAQQGRIREMTDPKLRVAALAKGYAASPENTLIVSPDNRSRLEINQAVRSEMRERGLLKDDERSFQVLTHRGELTGSDRAWAARYNAGDVLQYNTGSKEHGIRRNSLARVLSVDPTANEITVETDSGGTITYDPRRLRGVNVFEETSREFATGDRVQFTAPNKALRVANRDLGTIEAIVENKITVRLDGRNERIITFDAERFRQMDHGYAVTSHSAQGITAERVLVNADTSVHPGLLNSRFAYVSVSRASQEAMIFTDSLAKLSSQLSVDLSKSSALEVSLPKPTIAEPELALSI
jgi:ATP-dependent exoDNAse (exonuclease V) alpha subunit